MKKSSFVNYIYLTYWKKKKREKNKLFIYFSIYTTMFLGFSSVGEQNDPDFTD